jgi:hypothetical protein
MHRWSTSPREGKDADRFAGAAFAGAILVGDAISADCDLEASSPFELPACAIAIGQRKIRILDVIAVTASSTCAATARQRCCARPPEAPSRIVRPVDERDAAAIRTGC